MRDQHRLPASVTVALFAFSLLGAATPSHATARLIRQDLIENGVRADLVAARATHPLIAAGQIARAAALAALDRAASPRSPVAAMPSALPSAASAASPSAGDSGATPQASRDAKLDAQMRAIIKKLAGN